jgi:hypothetical protein
MTIQLIAKDSLFIAALKAGTDFRRTLVTQGQRKRNTADDVCGSDERLAELVNHCFWSSIAVEEGRAVRGTICICSPDEAPLARALQEPALVSVKTLVALLTASPRSSLAVHAGGNGLAIWGMLDATPMFTLRLRVAGAGTVVASEGRNVLAVLQGGVMHIPKSAGYINWVMLVANALDRANSFPDRMKRAARFLEVVTTMHRHGHGGALVVVPCTTDTWKRHVKFSFSFDDPSSLVLRRHLLEWEEAERLHQELELGQAGETPISLLPLYAQSAAAHRELTDSTLSLHKFRLPQDLRQLARLRGNATTPLGPPDWRTY